MIPVEVAWAGLAGMFVYPFVVAPLVKLAQRRIAHRRTLERLGRVR